MTDQPQGPGWWQAADLKWYPPELHADHEEPTPPDEQPQQPNDLNLSTQQHPEAPVSQSRPADRPPPDNGTQPWWRQQAILIPAALLAVVVIGIAIVITRQQHQNSNGSQHREPLYGAQLTLPFVGLNRPIGVAVDTAGAVYVTDWGDNRVLRLAAGSSSQRVLPFAGLSPGGVAVDASNVYVTDRGDNRVLRLAADSATQSVLPFAGLNVSQGVAVDAAGTV